MRTRLMLFVMTKLWIIGGAVLLMAVLAIWFSDSYARTQAAARTPAQPRTQAAPRTATSEIVYAEDGTPILNESDSGSQTDYVLAENARLGAS